MSIPSTPSSITVPVTRHKGYFIHEADLTIRVQNYMFRVHRFFLERESAYFRLRLDNSTRPDREPPGSSELNPLVLDEATSDAFACFLWVFYNPKYSVYNAAPEQWSMILDLAQKWDFKQVQELCLRELEGLNLTPVDRIHIYRRHKLDETLLIDSFEELTTRENPIGVEEGEKLGLKISIQIACAREKSRGPDTGGLRSPSTVRLSPTDLRGLISDIFQLPRIDTNGAADPGPFTAPVNTSDRIDRASALPASATVPGTPSKPGALSQSASTSEEIPPTNDRPNLRLQDSIKNHSRTRKASGSRSRWPNSLANF